METSPGMDEEPSGVRIKKGTLRTRVRRLFSAKQLYESLQPLYFLTFWHGLTPFFIKNDSQGQKKLHHSVFGYLNAVAHIVIYTIFYVITLLNNCESVAGYFFRTSITYVADLMQIMCSFIGVTVIYLAAILPKHHLQKSLETIQFMDDQLKEVGIKIMYSKILRFSCILLGTITIVNLLYTMGCFMLLNSAQVGPSIALHITFVLQHTVISLAITLFCCISRTLQLRLAMMQKV